MLSKIDGVRIATSDDEAELMALCRVAHAECGFGSFNEEKVRGHLQAAFNQSGSICGLVDGGAVLLTLTNWWWGDGELWVDRFLYVRPEFRSMEAFDKLASFCKLVCDSTNTNGVTNIPLLVGVQQLDRAATKVRLYERHFRMIGGYFIYGPTERGFMSAA